MIYHIYSLKPNQIQHFCCNQEVQLKVPGPAGEVEAVLPLDFPPDRLLWLRKGEVQTQHSVSHFSSL